MHFAGTLDFPFARLDSGARARDFVVLVVNDTARVVEFGIVLGALRNEIRSQIPDQRTRSFQLRVE